MASLELRPGRTSAAGGGRALNLRTPGTAPRSAGARSLPSRLDPARARSSPATFVAKRGRQKSESHTRLKASPAAAVLLKLDEHSQTGREKREAPEFPSIFGFSSLWWSQFVETPCLSAASFEPHSPSGCESLWPADSTCGLPGVHYLGHHHNYFWYQVVYANLIVYPSGA